MGSYIFGRANDPGPSFRRGLAEMFGVAAVTGALGGVLWATGIEPRFSILPDRPPPPHSCEYIRKDLKKACEQNTIVVVPHFER